MEVKNIEVKREKEDSISPKSSPKHSPEKRTTKISPGKSVVFYSPIEEKEVLVRTGAIEKSSFLHAFLHGYSKDYLYMDSYERRKAVLKLRKDLAKKMDSSQWEKESSNLIARDCFQENVSEILSDVYSYIQDGYPGKTRSSRKVIREIKNKAEKYSVICDMVTLTDMERKILPSVYDKCIDKSIYFCSEKIVEKAKKFYETVFKTLNSSSKSKIRPKKVKFCISLFVELLEAVVQQAEEMAFTHYISSLKNTALNVDNFLIESLSNRFNRDLYFIDGQSRLPYSEGNKVGKNKSIILVKINNYYEVLGRLLPDNKIKREFSYNDPLIECIRTFVYEPEKILSLYPRLIPYAKKKIGEKGEKEENRK